VLSAQAVVMGAIERTPIAETSQGEYDTSRVTSPACKKRESQRPDRGSDRCKQSFDPKSEIDSGNTARGASRIHCVAARMTVTGRGNLQDRRRPVSPGGSDGRDRADADRRDRSR
jgi:hypothetical protein